MQWAKLLTDRGKGFVVFVAFLGLVNSILHVSVLYAVTNLIQQELATTTRMYMAAAFVGVLAMSYWLNSRFRAHVVRHTNGIMHEFHMLLISRIQQAPYRSFETIEQGRILATVQDGRVLAYFAEQLANRINAIVVIFCGMLYLLWVSPIGFLLLLFICVFLSFVGMNESRMVRRELLTLRKLEENFFVFLNDILSGFRELKMSSVRNRRFYEGFVAPNRVEARHISDGIEIRKMRIRLAHQYCVYGILFLVVFIQPFIFFVAVSERIAFVVILLYTIGPAVNILNSIPYFTSLKVALSQMDDLSEHLKSIAGDKDAGAPLVSVDNRDLSTITLRAITYAYDDAEGNALFAVGPFNISFHAGHVVFITGGNGSGKSTLLKLIAGLYTPAQGELYVDGIAVGPADYQQYRDNIAVVFSDAYLFRENYHGYNLEEEHPELLEYLRAMRLSDVVRRPVNGMFRTDLSRGQQKRLALFYALLEKKSVLILDEWAAEQDPEFKQYFYQELLPLFRAQGKMVIVASHDDAYFHCADRIIQVDGGRVVRDDVAIEI